MKSSVAILIILFLLLGHKGFSQNFIFKGGLNLSNLLHKTDDGKPSTDYTLNPGVHLGASMEISLNEHLYIDFGLSINQKGFKTENVDENDFGSYKYVSNLLYLDLPVLFKFYHPIENDLKLIGAIGPYVGIGFGGNNKFSIEALGNSNTSTSGINWGNRNTESDYSNPDYGLAFGAGVEIQSFQIMIGYDLGIANISSTSFNDTVLQNRVARVSVGYKLGK